MLQDAEAGRPLELDAIVGVVHELGARLGVATPSVDAIFGLARLYGRVHGLYPNG
jgi:2-dehydropantoate 2-reductase